MTSLRAFHYKAVAIDGKTRQGVVSAASEAEAFGKLRGENLTPVRLRPVQPKMEKTGAGLFGHRAGLTDSGLEDALSNLAVLLRAGADIRTALSVVDGGESALRDVSQSILGGSSVESAFASVIPGRNAHLRGLIAAGEARGELAAGLEAAASVLGTNRKIRQQLLEALSYPAFVFVTALAALCVILLVVVPAIAPLLQDTGKEPPIYFQIIVALSDGLRLGWPYLLAGAAMVGTVIWFGVRYGRLKQTLEKWLVAGPLGGIVRGLVFGGFAKSLGDALSSGATITDAIRLCQRGIGNSEARLRLNGVTTAVRQGRRLSEALRQVVGFPMPIIRLAEVGEASGTLGPMLARAGQREETQALARIDKLSKLLGPGLIMLVGALIGGLLGGVLTALTDIGGMAGT